MEQVTLQELEQEQTELKACIEHEKAVDARQTVKILERKAEILRLAILGKKLNPFEA